MGVRLHGKGGEFRANGRRRNGLTELAYRYGWVPLGVRPTGGGRRSADYFCNSGRRVDDEDARNLADALERSLPDIPEHDALGSKDIDIGGVRGIPRDTEATPQESFRGTHGNQRVRNFIACRRTGGFSID